MTGYSPVVGSAAVGDPDVVGAVDAIEGRPHVVIADIGRDDAWIAAPATAAATLRDWR